MTAFRFVEIGCDDCYDAFDHHGKNSTEVRREAKKKGWHRSGDRDYCPPCWDNRA